MISTLTNRGQTTVPLHLRKKYSLGRGSQLEWIETGEIIKVIPMPKNILKVLRGCAKGENLGRKLLEARKNEKIMYP